MCVCVCLCLCLDYICVLDVRRAMEGEFLSDLSVNGGMVDGQQRLCLLQLVVLLFVHLAILLIEPPLSSGRDLLRGCDF